MADKLDEIKLEATKFIAERLATEGFIYAGKTQADASDFLPWICITISAGIYRPEEDIFVKVRLANAERTVEWRTVLAATIEEGIKKVAAMDDVEVVLEGSLVPGGVIT